MQLIANSYRTECPVAFVAVTIWAGSTCPGCAVSKRIFYEISFYGTTRVLIGWITVGASASSAFVFPRELFYKRHI